MADTVLTADIGPCTWETSPVADELVGLRVDSDVTLDCAGHSIIGPFDAQREEFGIKFGSSSRPIVDAVVRNCQVTGFWWGIYVSYANRSIVEDNITIANGWMSETENGTGYGIDIAHSNNAIVRRNQVIGNGNEGIHLTSSAGVDVVDNLVKDNGFEQVYIINADNNQIVGNRTSGGRQGLEMRDSDSNDFSYNHWGGSPKQWLEDNNDQNTFIYDHFEGLLSIQSSSNQNRFEYCSMRNLGDDCVRMNAANNTFFKSHFSCKKDVVTTVAQVVQRSVSVDRIGGRKHVTIELPGCTADMDLDQVVGASDQLVMDAAMGSVVGDPTFAPKADLDHDGAIDSTDQTIFDAQSAAGACAFENKVPIAVLGRSTLTNRPDGQPDTIRLLATTSRDASDDALLRFDFRVENLITGEVLLDESFEGIPREQAFVDHDYPPGKYQAFLTVMDAFGSVSKPKRTAFGVN